MPVEVVVGGQYGSEGKGKIVALTARQYRSPIVVRCGGPNSGHTTLVRGTERVLRQLPAAAGQEDALLAIAAGCVVEEELLVKEIKECGIERERLVVDPRAILLEAGDQAAELSLVGAYGSTGSGNGNALARRVLRDKNARLVKDSFFLGQHARIEPVAPILHKSLDANRWVIIEGTQGFGLSLLHGAEYPFVTSKDTTASAFLMEAGLSPREVDEITLVIRTFPIRVGGCSGGLPTEISWGTVQVESGAPNSEPEFTSVTHKLRRVGRFDLELVREACRYNKPTSLAVMGLDRINFQNRGITELSELTTEAKEFVWMVEAELQVPVRWVGTGFGTLDVINIQKTSKVAVHG